MNGKEPVVCLKYFQFFFYALSFIIVFTSYDIDLKYRVYVYL